MSIFESFEMIDNHIVNNQWAANCYSNKSIWKNIL